jgi:fucose permease
MYFIMCIPAILIIERFGMRVALILGVLLSFIGSWIALMVDPIGVRIFGQLMIDAGFPLGISCITKFTAQWFPYQERFYATSAATLIGMLGFGLGDSSVFIFDINKPIDFAITLTVVCVITLIALFFFKERPEHVPSLSQAQKQSNYEFSLKDDLKEIFKN